MPNTQYRLKFLSVNIFVTVFVLTSRLFYWQVIQGKELAKDAKEQQVRKETIHTQRGEILASDNTPLATSIDSWLLYAYLPDVVEDKRKVANLLAPITLTLEKEDESTESAKPKKTERELLMDEAIRLEGSLNETNTTWVPLKRKLTPVQKRNIEAFKINGLGFDLHEARFYPESSSSAHLLGFVGKDKAGDDKGYFGLEGYYDLELSGKPGYRERESNPLGIPLLFKQGSEIKAVEGVNLITHIDKTVQMLVEKKLELGIKRYEALSGTVIVMRPEDGAILSIASYPSFSPGNYTDSQDEFFKNPAISDSFEPGSIFKPLVMAAGLDAGVIKPDTKCDICHEAYKVDKYFIETWDRKYHKDSTMTEVLMHSDNVGMTFIGLKLGKEKLIDYIKKFGFGEITQIDLQGEQSPQLRKKNEWTIVDQATATFGQGIAVTPIQMVYAMSAITGKGIPVRPQVVDKLEKDGKIQDIKPEKKQRVISEEAAAQITEIMVNAAKQGEAKWTVTKGFKVAGKTGTAQIPVSGHYDAEKTIASFIGFAPADDPKFLMLVTLREAKTSQWASETAAPLWFSIANELFTYLNIQPDN